MPGGAARPARRAGPRDRGPGRRLDRRHRRGGARGRRRQGPAAHRARRCRPAGSASRTPASSSPTPRRRPTCWSSWTPTWCWRRTRSPGAVELLLRRGRRCCRRTRGSPAPGRLVQPLLQWSWLTFLPLRAMERSPRPSLAAAGGQWLVVDRAGYRPRGRARGGARRGAGGHRAGPGGEAVRRPDRAGRRLAAGHLPDVHVLADAGRRLQQVAVGVVRLAGRCGRRRGPAPSAVRGSAGPLVCVAVVAGGGRRWPRTCSGSPAGWSSARATGGRAWPDALAHPASVVVFALAGRAVVPAAAAGPADLAGAAGMSRVVVIGAGVGGLTRPRSGWPRPGTRWWCTSGPRWPAASSAVYERDGFRFDTGPSLLTLPQVFADLTGLSLQPLDPVVRHVFPDGTVLDSSSVATRSSWPGSPPRSGAGGGRRLGTGSGGGPRASGRRPGARCCSGRSPRRRWPRLSWRLGDLAAIAPGRIAARAGPALPARPPAADAAGPVRDVHRRRPAPGAGRAGRDPVRGAGLRRLVPARRPGHAGRRPAGPLRRAGRRGGAGLAGRRHRGRRPMLGTRRRRPGRGVRLASGERRAGRHRGVQRGRADRLPRPAAHARPGWPR